ncbi:MAG TPA: cation-transporting P-type ATPase, partial [Rhodocyclaceae bacterium]|nr:cation-transporting P-type ATPase [Rhodocyclaceae bacterium]
MAPERAAAWHARSPQDVLDALRSSPHGLTTADAAERLRRYGPNRLPGRPGPGPWQRLAQQFHQPLIYILLASGAIALLLGEWADAGVIFGVVLVNALIGFVQEGKAADALAALARSVASTVTVLRDGRMVACEAVELVPGDVVRLGAGDKVPADLRLFDARSLQIAEAALTGESVAVAKDTATVPADG